MPITYSYILSLSILCLLLTGCGKNLDLPSVRAASAHQGSAAAPKNPKLITISNQALSVANLQVSSAQLSTVSSQVDTTAEVQANINLVTHINSPVAGRVAKVHVQLGDHVCSGTALLSIHSPDIEQVEADLLQQDAQIRSDLQKELLQIDSDIAVTIIQRNFASSAYERSKQLFEEQISSKADLDNTRTQFEKLTQELESLKKKRQTTNSIATSKMLLVLGPLEQRLQLMGLTSKQVTDLLKSRKMDPLVEIRSSEDGIVCERKANIGEMIDSTRDLMTIADFSTVWLTAAVAEKDISKLRIGAPIILKVDSLPNQSFSGKIDYISDSINPDTRTLSVRAQAINQHKFLKPKMFGRMSILVSDRKGLTVPIKAIQDADGLKVVYVQTGPNSFEERVVQTGTNSEGRVEILSGLRLNEKVVSQGSFWLRSLAIEQSNSQTHN